MTDLLVKSQQLIKTGSSADIQDFLPDLIVQYEKLDYDASKTEIEYDLYRIARYEHWKNKKTKGEIKWTDKEIEMEAKKEALKKFGDQLLWKKVANHYKLNIEMLSQRRIDLAVENKNLREAGL